MQNIHMMHMFSFQRCNSWCICPMRWCKCNIYPWWCQRTYLPVMQMSPYRDKDAKCLVVQMLSNGHVMMQMLMQVCHDVNVHVRMSWCKCPLVGMSWCKCSLVHAMMQMFFVWMQWMWMPAWVCNECQRPLAGMPWHEMLWCKHNLFKIFFYFQNEASTTPETKIFSNSIYYSWKVIFFLA